MLVVGGVVRAALDSAWLVATNRLPIAMAGASPSTLVLTCETESVIWLLTAVGNAMVEALGGQHYRTEIAALNGISRESSGWRRGGAGIDGVSSATPIVVAACAVTYICLSRVVRHWQRLRGGLAACPLPQAPRPAPAGWPG